MIDPNWIQTHKKKLNENIKAYQMAGYEVIMHYYKGKYYLESQLKAETENDKMNKEREIEK